MYCKGLIIHLTLWFSLYPCAKINMQVSKPFFYKCANCVHTRRNISKQQKLIIHSHSPNCKDFFFFFFFCKITHCYYFFFHFTHKKKKGGIRLWAEKSFAEITSPALMTLICVPWFWTPLFTQVKSSPWALFRIHSPHPVHIKTAIIQCSVNYRTQIKM